MRKKKQLNQNLVYGALAVIIVLSIVNAYFISVRSEKISSALVEVKENSRPADIEVIMLTVECQECFGVESVLDSLKEKNVNVVEEKTVDITSDEGKALVSSLGISKLPTLIVSGEVKKPSIESIWSGWEERDGKYVLTDIIPPYFSPSKGVVGKVTVTNIIDSSCSECVSLSQVVSFLGDNGVFLSEEKRVEYSSTEGKALISKFGIQQIPAIVLSNNILEYPTIAEMWDQVGATEKEGHFALHAQVPPYRDVATGEVKGLVSLTYLEDLSCSSCYNVSVNKQILAGMGIFPVSESHVDISSAEGSSLVKKYKIEKAPIILISPEGSAYTSLNQVWPQVGSIEEDGWFVMRNPQLLGAYKDLVSGEVVSPQ